MKLEIDVNNLRDVHLMIATPMYGGNCSGPYTRSLLSFQEMATSLGIKLSHYFMYNESLIPRARNYCTDQFLNSDATHLLFIDSDISFQPENIIHLLGFVEGNEGINDGEPLDILCAAYPKKTINWNIVEKATKNDVSLEDVTTNFAVNFPPNVSDIDVNAPTEVLESGTGFMLIRRRTLVRWKEAYPQAEYYPDHVETKEWNGERPIHAFFDSVIDDKRCHLEEELQAWKDNNTETLNIGLSDYMKQTFSYIPDRTYSKRYLSEDYYFCQMARRADMKVWVCPWLELTHSGTYNFKGTLGKNLIAKAKINET